MVKKEFKTLSLKEIVPYEKNPRKNDEAAVEVAKSIKEIDNLDPIEVDENNIILSGHTRLKALKQLGYTETEVIKYTGLSEAKKKAYRILANKTAEKAEWDEELLDLELEDLAELDEIDMSDFGFELSDGGG